MRIRFTSCLLTLTISLCFLFQSKDLIADSPQIIDSLQNELIHANGIEKLKLYKDLIKSYRNIDPAKGITISKEALLLSDQLGDIRMKAIMLNEVGVCYRKLNIPEKSLSLHLESLKLFEELRDSTGIAFTLANIGNVYHFYNDLDKALDYHFQSLYLKEFLKDEPQIAYSQNAIGMVLADKEEYARAMDFFISAMSIRKKNDQQLELANIYANIGKVMVKLNRYEDALDYLNQALEVYNGTKNKYGEALVHNQIAELYAMKGDLDKAIIYLDNAEILALNLKNISVLHFNYKLRKKVLKGQKKFEEALISAEKSILYNDSLFSERRNYEMTEIQVRYETQQLDAENEILRLNLQKEELRSRYILLGAASIILILSIAFLTWLYIRNKRANRALESLNLSLEKRVIERTNELNDQIAAKQRTFNSLKQSEEKFRAISETSPFGIAVTDRSGKIFFFNPRLPVATGIPSAEFINGTWMHHIIVEDRKTIEQIWNNAHQQHCDIKEASFRILSKNTIQWMHIKGSPMSDDQNFIGLVVVIENITKNKQFEQELIKSKNKAEESDRLKSAFLANMSHEIRTPMNAILGFSDLMASDDYSLEEKSEFVDMIRSSGKLLLNLINDIIDISKIEAGELKIQLTTFKVVELIDDLHLTFRQNLDQIGKKDIRLIVSRRDEIEDDEITTDKLRLQQIMTNLLSNASKFTTSGQIEFGVIKVSNKFQFYVKDSGIGIPDSKLEVIFERFRQADDSHTRTYGGTGLGLAISKNLTQLLNGAIWVESAENKGTAFYLTLPAPQTVLEKQMQQFDFSGKTILIAEDVENNYQLIEIFLTESKAKVLHAKNGLIAVDMALNHKPDIILMDIQMPEMDGISAMQQLRKHKLTLPIVAITAFALQDEEKTYIDQGFDSYLSKPLSREKVYAALNLFLNS